MPNTYLTRTPSGAGNRKTYTISFWVKRAKIGSRQSIFANQDGDGQNGVYFDFYADDTLAFLNYGTGAYLTPRFETTQVFRDTSAWYHIVYAVDTTQGTESNRVKIYVNGNQVTNFDVANYPSLNQDTLWNRADTIYIGTYAAGGNYFGGSMSHMHHTDGTAYDATAFGEYDANGVWKIKTDVSVTYGTNGFFILKDGNSVTDQSGNGNNFTVGGGTLTNTEDSPSNVFATLNPLDKYYSQATFSNGNNQSAMTSSYETYTTSTLGVSKGKYYCEGKVAVASAFCMLGIVGRYSTASSHHVGYYVDGYGYNGGSATYWTNNSSSAYGNTFTTNDIIGIALDLDNNKLYFSKNGTWQNSGDPTSGATGTGAISISDPDNTIIGSYLFAFGCRNNDGVTWQTNFGNGYFGTTPVASAGTNASGIGIFNMMYQQAILLYQQKD